MIPDLPPPAPPAGGGRLRDLMLGIFLVQLAFFIVLVSLARPDFGRSKQVLANVAEVFGPMVDGDGKPRRGAAPTTGQEGEPVLREVGTFAGGLFGDRAVAITGPGDELTLSLPLAALFDEDRDGVRPPGDRLFDALVAAFGALPPGRTLSLTLAFPFDASAEGARSPTSDALLLARAGAMARRLIARGVPAQAIALADGAPAGTARLSIRVASSALVPPSASATTTPPAPAASPGAPPTPTGH